MTAVTGSASATVTITTNGKTTTRTYDTREEMERECPGYKVFLYANSIVDVVLHFTMIAGAIGLLMMRSWGWWLSLVWVGLRFAYQLGTFGYLWLKALPATQGVARAIPRDDNHVCSGLSNGNTLYLFFWMLFSAAFILYPILIGILPSPAASLGERSSERMPTLTTTKGKIATPGAAGRMRRKRRTSPGAAGHVTMTKRTRTTPPGGARRALGPQDRAMGLMGLMGPISASGAFRSPQQQQGKTLAGGLRASEEKNNTTRAKVLFPPQTHLCFNPAPGYRPGKW